MEKLVRFVSVLSAGVLTLGGLGVGLAAVLAGIIHLPALVVGSITLAVLNAVVKVGLAWLKDDPPLAKE